MTGFVLGSNTLCYLCSITPVIKHIIQNSERILPQIQLSHSNLNQQEKSDIMIEEGTKADFNFTVKAVQHGEEKELNFKDLLNRPTIVSVYMKNNTDSCDRQTKSLAEEAGWFDKKGYNLVAISKDTCGSHKRYANKMGINYTLVSDPDYKFAEATDSIVEKQMFGREFEGPSRSAFVIDTDGTILSIVEKVNTKDHAGELKELVEQLK